MKYKVKETNLSKLKNYIDANTKTKNERETERFYDTVYSRDEKRIQTRPSCSDMLPKL